MSIMCSNFNLICATLILTTVSHSINSFCSLRLIDYTRRLYLLPQTLNPFSLGMVTQDNNDSHLILTELKAVDKTPAWLSEEPDKKVYLHLGLHRTNSPWNVPGVYDWGQALELGGISPNYYIQLSITYIIQYLPM